MVCESAANSDSVQTSLWIETDTRLQFSRGYSTADLRERSGSIRSSVDVCTFDVGGSVNVVGVERADSAHCPLGAASAASHMDAVTKLARDATARLLVPDDSLALAEIPPGWMIHDDDAPVGQRLD